MAGKFVLQHTADGQYLFNLQAANGEVVLTSERYMSKDAALAGIASVRINAPIDARYERLTSSDGRPYFVLKGANGRVLGHSETYSSAAARDQGIDSVEHHAPEAELEDRT
ncbi:YegP family protein [Calidithermus chliarophilus]|uniref:YegP family protein n=1 Tax=Calidithermus chliarophilus TaxID=52023 RepID=UPI0004278B61|nr:YegP family protein [Calidithermus chliarophilus]